MSGGVRRLSKSFDLIRKENRAFFDGWIASLELSNHSPNTIDKYDNAVRIFFSWNYDENNDKLFVDLMNRDFTQYIAYIKKVVKAGSRRAALYKSSLVSLSKYIEKEYEDIYPLFKNKAKNIELYSGAPRHPKIIISPEELQSMLNKLVELKEYQAACWLALLAYSGCRRAEGIQVKTAWFTKEYEHFPEPYTMYKTPPIRTKGKGEEGKVIPKYIFKLAFQPYLDLWMQERERLGITSEHLFVCIRRDKIYEPTTDTATEFAHKIRRIFGNGFHNHCMRHYFATDLRNRHFPNNIILMIVKWENESMINHYDDTDDDKALDEYFKSLIEKKDAPTKEELMSQLSQLTAEELYAMLRR